MLRPGGKGEGRYGSTGAVVLGLDGVVAGLLNLVVPIASQDVTVGTELANILCWPGRESPVNV